MGDSNARTGSHIIPYVKRFNKDKENENGELLGDCCQNNLRVNNMFFEHQ